MPYKYNINNKILRYGASTKIVIDLFSLSSTIYNICFQSAALVAVTNVSEYLDETAIRRMILPKTKVIYEKNQSDLKIVSNVLSCVERTLDRLDKSQIIDEVLPLLYDIRLSDPQITLRVVSKYPTGSSQRVFANSVASKRKAMVSPLLSAAAKFSRFS